MRTLNKGPPLHTAPACGRRTFWQILCGCLTLTGSPHAQGPLKAPRHLFDPREAHTCLPHHTEGTQAAQDHLAPSPCPAGLLQLAPCPPSAGRSRLWFTSAPSLSRGTGEPLLLCSSQPATRRARAQPPPSACQSPWVAAPQDCRARVHVEPPCRVSTHLSHKSP